jgi:hypothetical protein
LQNIILQTICTFACILKFAPQLGRALIDFLLTASFYLCMSPATLTFCP